MSSNAQSTALPCTHCGTMTTQRCGRCKSLRLCSKECMKAVWKTHKPDCNNIAAASAAIGDPRKDLSNPEAPVFSMDPELLLKVSAKNDEVYARYGLESPPERGSTMATRTKIEFFLDMLDANESSSEINAPLPLPAKLFLNRRFNNTYKHAVEHFTGNELNRLNRMMRERRIGEFNKIDGN